VVHSKGSESVSVRFVVGSESGEAPMAKRILVVEDREDSRTILVAILTRFWGYETIEAANGTEAVKKAVSEKPDLILMDLDLPDISGIDAAKALKENPNTAHIPIIAQTAWSWRQWKGKVLKAGMVDYLEKPVSIDLMKATIERFILP
jgi:two-component system, cell cycle response regulator DivK